jgi:hypothetical protein
LPIPIAAIGRGSRFASSKKSDQPFELSRRIGARGELENSGAGLSGSSCQTMKLAERGRVAQVVEGENQLDLAFTDLLEERPHLPNDPDLEVDESSPLEKVLEQSPTGGGRQLAGSAFGRMAGGKNERRV